MHYEAFWKRKNHNILGSNSGFLGAEKSVIWDQWLLRNHFKPNRRYTRLWWESCQSKCTLYRCSQSWILADSNKACIWDLYNHQFFMAVNQLTPTVSNPLMPYSTSQKNRWVCGRSAVFRKKPWMKVLEHNPFQSEIKWMNFHKALTMTNFLEQPCLWLYFIHAIYSVIS